LLQKTIQLFVWMMWKNLFMGEIINFHNYWFLIWPSYFNLSEIIRKRTVFSANIFRPKERKKTLDDFDRCVIKRTVHSMYNRKIAPTVSKIKKEIEDWNSLVKLKNQYCTRVSVSIKVRFTWLLPLVSLLPPLFWR
jgi:hypothetical protein